MTEDKPKQKRGAAEKAIDIFSGLIDWVFIIFFLIVLLFACYAIYDSMKVYDEADLPEVVMEHVEKKEDGSREIDFASLIAGNPDTAAWLVLDDMNIDYLVMHHSDNTYYLDHGYDNKYLSSGMLFVDYRNGRNWDEDYILIYGHNMNGDMMFGPLNKFHEKDFFESHRTGKLYTPNGNFSLEVIAETVTDKDDASVYGVPNLKNDLPQVKSYINERTNQRREADVASATKIIALTTCRGTSGMRQIVYLKATKD